MKHQTTWAEFCSDSINKPRIQLKRFDDGKENRFYFWFDEEGEVKTAAGITSILSRVMPEGSHIIDWKVNLGKDWKRVLNEAADYGTIMHQIYNEWLKNKFVPKELLEAARNMAIKGGRGTDMPEKDLLAFMKFCEDFDVKPLVLEGLLLGFCQDGSNYAMAIDCLCRMTIKTTKKESVEDGEYQRGDKKGQKKYKEVRSEEYKHIIANIDFKSNYFEKETKSFFESHMYQLIAAKKAVKSNFGIDVDAMYNFSPNAWRKEPTYSLKEWKPSDLDYDIFDMLMRLASKKGHFEPKGTIFLPPEFNDSTKSSDYRMVDYITYIKEVFGN